MKANTLPTTSLSLVLLLAASISHAGLTLSTTTPNPPNAQRDPCLQPHVGLHCWSTALPLEVINPGVNRVIEAAFMTPIVVGGTNTFWDPTGWTINSGPSLNLSLKVNGYGAYNACPAEEGASLTLIPPAGSTFQWIQFCKSNRPKYPGLPSEWWLDTKKDGDRTFPPPQFPYVFADGSFQDSPGRYCEAMQHITWEAYLYLAEIDYENMTVVYHDGIHWGFTVDCIPEPGTTQIVLYGVAFLLTGRRRHRSQHSARS